jgi:hypothetical protein
MIAVARAAGFEPVPAVVTSRRDEALAAVATDGRPTLVGRVSNAIEDRIVGPDSAAAAVDALLPHGAVMVRRLAPVPPTTALVAGDAVIGEVPPAAAGVARDLAGRLGAQLVSITLQQSDGRLWFVDANLHPLVPGSADDTLLEPAARGLADAFEAAA